jgi:hypothetical protein
MASRSYRAVRMRSAVQNEFAEPCEPSEIKLKASLGIRLACMESYHPQAIYHRPACVRSGLASPQRAEMDLQKPCQVRTGGLIEARSCELPKLVKWIQQQKDRLRAVFLFSAPSFRDQQERPGSRPGPHGAGPNRFEISRWSLTTHLTVMRLPGTKVHIRSAIKPGWFNQRSPPG